MPYHRGNQPAYMRTPVGFIDMGGYLVEKKFYDFVTRLKEYDENLEVACLDGQLAEINDAPFIILERCTDGQLRKVFECWELNESVFERIVAADSNYDLLSAIEKKEKEAEDLVQRRYRDKMEENKELVEGIVQGMQNKSKFTYKDEEAGDTVTIYENRMPERHTILSKKKV